MKKSILLSSTAFAATSLKRFDSPAAGVPRRTLFRMPDGSLAFKNGTRVMAYELVPGETYDVINHPSCHGGKS